MAPSVKPEFPQQDDLDKALSEIRGKKQPAAADPMDSALAEIRTGGKLGDIDLRTPAAPPMRLRPVVVSKPEAPPAPPPIAAADAARVGQEPVGLAGRLLSHAPGQSGHFANDVAESAMEMVTHPVATARALAETPARAGYALGKYTRGEGSGREAAIGAAQTGAMLLGGPAERLAEPVVERLIGEAAAPVVTRTALGAATGATFTPDRPMIGATLGAAGGALSSRGMADEKAAARQARFDELAKQHPDWFGEAIAPEAPKQLGDGTVPKVATARIVDEQAPPSNEPDYTVEEPTRPPVSPIVEQKGVFGGALEQHGKDFAEGKTPPPIPAEPAAPAEAPSSPINPIGEEAPAAPPATLPTTIDEVDAAMDANSERYRASTDPEERAHIMELQNLLEDHRESLQPAQEKHDYASTQLDLPPETSAAIKGLSDAIPEAHLAEDGRETNPHITVKYGLHGEDPEAVRQLLANEPPVTVKMGKTSFFPNGESGSGDVLKVDVDSPALHRLNKKIADALPNTETHPVYKPHATVAYLKPGMGKKYAGDKSLVGHTVTLDHVTFSAKDGTKTLIPLGGKAKAPAVRKPKPVAAPVHESARLPSGRLRDNLAAVKDDGLIREMFQLLGAEDQRDQQSSIYRTVVNDDNMSGPVTVPTIKGGRNLQAEALHRIELKKGAAKRIEAVLNARGLTDEHITRRYVEMTETAADVAAEREGLDSDRGDTSFDFEPEGGNNESDVRAAEKPAGKEAANTPPAGEAEGTAKGLGRREISRPPESETASPKRLGLKGGISAREMVQRAKAGETREAVTAINGEEPTALSTDKKQSEMFSGEEVGEQLPEQGDLLAMQRVDPASNAANVAAGRRLLKALADGVPITGASKLHDTSSGASRELLQRLAEKPYTRQLAQRVEKAFADVAAAIAKRFDFPPAEFGGLDVSHELVGVNIKRDTWAIKAKVLGLPAYTGPTSNLVLLNPYMAGLEVAANPRLRPAEFAAALSESTYSTIVHELAHQIERGHDEAFTKVHSDYSGAAAAVAAQVLKELDLGWQVALDGGIGNDVLALQQGVWNAQQQQQHDAGPEAEARNSRRLPVRSDADASHLRSSKGDGGLGKGNGSGRLGVRADVRRSEGGSEDQSGERAGAGRAPRHGESGTGEAAPAARERLRLPEPSGLTQPRSNIRPAEFIRAIKSYFNPESLGPEGMGAAGTLRHQGAEAYHRLAISTHALKGFQAKVEKLTREEQVQLWDDAEHGRPTGDPELDAGNHLLRIETEKRTQELIALDRLKAEKTIENYVGRFWSQTSAKSGRDFLRAIMGRRPHEGPKSFLKQRDLDWFVDGLKREDLVPATYNYVESQLAKIAEMERVISAEHTLRQEKALGRAKPIMLGQEPPEDYRGESWVRIDRTGEDPAFNIYLPPDVQHWEAVDTLVYGKLQKLIKDLGVTHERSPKIGGTRLGYAMGDKHIATKFGGAEGVISHEIGHILDERYGLGDQIDAAIGAAPKRTVAKGKRAGKQVPDYKAEGKDAAQRRKTLREELRQLANLRRETMAGVPETKDLGKTDRQYLHSRPEKMANMVDAYVNTRDRFRQVAPGIFQIFDGIVADHPELHPLRDIQPSLSREEHAASTRVSGIITGGAWYAPKDAAAVWQNHLSRGLAGNAIYDAVIAPIHAGTQMLLGFSGFHGTVIATEGAFSDLALATDNLANTGGRMGRIPKQVGRALVSPVAGVTFGRRVMQEYRIPGTHPELKRVLDAMIAGGFRGRATSELWSGDRKDRLKRAFREALYGESKGRQLWGASRLPLNSIWAGVEMASGPLMSKYVPLMKTAATYNAVAQALEKLPLNTSIDELHRVMGDVVKEMDYRFGQVDYDNHFINRFAKDMAQLVFLAPGWTFGTLALAGRGLSDVAKLPKRAWRVAAGKSDEWAGEGDEPPPELIGRSAAYWIGAVLGTMLINGTLTYFSTGERPHGKDYWAFRDGTKDDAGNWNRHTVPGYLMHDIYGWSKHPVHTFKNKFAPTLAFFARLAENKDYFGDMVYDPDADLPTKAKQAGKALLREHMPLSAQNYLEGKKRGEGGNAEIARNIFGVTPARRELVRTPAQNKLAEYLGRHSPETRTPEEADKGELHGQVADAVRKGEELPPSVLAALAAGKIKRETLFKWLAEARTPAIVGQFKRLTLEEAQRVWDLANDQEKALWAAAYRTKVVNGRN